jgi:sensor histidine kinase YesM
MTKTLTRQQVSDLYSGLQGVASVKGAKFAYAVARNISLLKNEIEALSEAYKMDEGYTTYEKERMELAKSHAEVDDKGKPKTTIVNGSSEFVVKDHSAFEADFEKLKETHSDAFYGREKQVEEFKELLESETEVELHALQSENVPEDITAGQLTSIFEIVAEPEEDSV